MGEGDFFQGKGVKNLNWEILTKNLVTFKRCNRFKMTKNFNILEVHWKNQFLGDEGFTKAQYIAEIA